MWLHGLSILNYVCNLGCPWWWWYWKGSLAISKVAHRDKTADEQRCGIWIYELVQGTIERNLEINYAFKNIGLKIIHSPGSLYCTKCTIVSEIYYTMHTIPFIVIPDQIFNVWSWVFISVLYKLYFKYSIKYGNIKTVCPEGSKLVRFVNWISQTWHIIFRAGSNLEKYIALTTRD
jgi:hypothetical protein